MDEWAAPDGAGRSGERRAQAGGHEPDPAPAMSGGDAKVYAEVYAKVYAKVTWRLLPFLTLCYTVAYLDRVNVGFAKLQMAGDLAFSDTVFGLGAGVFFVGYLLFEIPSNMVLRRVGPRRWIARIMITWGLISAAFVLVTTPLHFYVLRFLLGVAEAGFFPGLVYTFTIWFPAHRRARIIATLMAAIPISAIFGNPLSGWIMDNMHAAAGLAGWQWMFLVEAVPALLLGIATLFRLDDSIRAARWLTEAEKDLLERAIATDTREKPVQLSSIAAILRNPMVWLVSVIGFSFGTGQYALSFWMPSLIKQSGVSGDFRIGLVSAIPQLFTVVAMLAVSRHADLTRERRWHLAVPALIGAAGFIASTRVEGVAASVAMLSVASAASFACAPLFWSLPTAFLSGAGAAAGIAVISAFANLSGLAGNTIMGTLLDLTGSTSLAMTLMAGALAFGGLLVLALPSRVVDR